MRRTPDAPESHERWLVSYADFITLLMIFFVVMYAMSNVDSAKYQKLAQSLNAALTGAGGHSVLPNNGQIMPNSGQGPSLERLNPVPPGVAGEGRDKALEESQIKQIQSDLQTYFQKEGVAGDVKAELDQRGLVITLRDTLLFQSGQAVVNPRAIPALIEVADELNKLPNYIRVEGHTDNVPIRTSQYPSNWELSAMRATTVLRLFINGAGVPPGKVVAMGYADTRPVADNSTPEGRALNRRVEIVLMDSRYNALENLASPPPVEQVSQEPAGARQGSPFNGPAGAPWNPPFSVYQGGGERLAAKPPLRWK